MSFNDYFVTV